MNKALDKEVAALRAAGRKGGRHHPLFNKNRQWLLAEANKNLIMGQAVSQGRKGNRGLGYAIGVHIDHDSLIDGLHRKSVHTTDSNGANLPIETIRRLACEHGLIPQIFNSDGVILDQGRTVHLATDAQRFALAAMYPTCGVGDCEIPFDQCEIHHIKEWARDLGPTDLRNLVPMCRVGGGHHHAVHEGGWRLELDPDTRKLFVYFPDGTLHSVSQPPGLGPQGNHDPP